MNDKRHTAGFTLIEMLVALAMIVTIVSIVYGSYAATTRSMDACRRQMASAERGCLVLRQMARQIRCACAPATGSWAAGSAARQGSHGAAAPLPVAASKPPASFRGEASHPQGEVLSFVTTSAWGAGLDGRAGLSRVAYYYDRPAATLSVARRDVAELLRGEGAPDQVQAVLHDVAGIELAFHDGRQWLDTWDSVRQRGLPRAVRIALVLASETDRPRRFTVTVPIFCQADDERRG